MPTSLSVAAPVGQDVRRITIVNPADDGNVDHQHRQEFGTMQRRWVYAILMVGVMAMLAVGAVSLLGKQAALYRLATRGIDAMPTGIVKRQLVAALGIIGPAGGAWAQSLPPAPPTRLGINLAEIRYYSSTVPFANMVVASDWQDSAWRPLSDERQDRDGNIRSLPADGVAMRFLLVPPTGPEGFEVRCTFTGSGTLSVAGVAGRIEPGRNTLRFRAVNDHGKQAFPWLVLKNVDPKNPPRDLDCRDARLDRSVRFRPEFLRTVRGFGVIRFMDWQNANANEAVPWSKRHTPASINLGGDGVAIEDMLALTRELGADPWFVMPWNADDDYIRHFAQMVRSQLPAGRSVYVEVGNEVWNSGFPVAKQAMKEGLERKFSAEEHEAGMRRYAERTAEVMRVWETVFAGRQGLVRVIATQQVWPRTAEIALSFQDTAKHVDALATASYFGTTLGGTDTTRDSGFRALSTELTTTLKNIADNRRVALGYGKRYISYEGGQGLALPMQVPLSGQIQRDPAMYDLYRRYLAGWQREAGDVLCLFNSVSRPTSWGAWGLSEWEDETVADAPKLRAVRDFQQAQRP